MRRGSISCNNAHIDIESVSSPNRIPTAEYNIAEIDRAGHRIAIPHLQRNPQSPTLQPSISSILQPCNPPTPSPTLQPAILSPTLQPPLQPLLQPRKLTLLQGWLEGWRVGRLEGWRRAGGLEGVGRWRLEDWYRTAAPRQQQYCTACNRKQPQTDRTEVLQP